MSLPPTFAKLSKYLEKWAHDDFLKRYAARVQSSQSELQKFYDDMLPEMPSIMAFLDKDELGHSDIYNENLGNLALSFMDIASAIELFNQPTVPHGFDWSRIAYLDFLPSFSVKEPVE